MAYPYTILTKKVRRSIMVGLIFIFCIVAPATVLYTAGYRYNWEFHRIEQTGVISIDVLPHDATVTVNGRSITKEMPLRLANRAPGTYHVTISKPGYKTWEKDITVESKRSTYIKNVTLFRDTLPVPLSTAAALKSIHPDWSGRYLLTISEYPGRYDITFWDTVTNQSSVIARTPVLPAIEWSAMHSLALIATPLENGATLELFDPAPGVLGKTHQLTKNLKDTPFQWSRERTRGAVYIEQNQQIEELSFEDTEVVGVAPTSTSWYVDAGRRLWVANQERHTVFPWDDPTQAIAYAGNDTAYTIIDINRDRLILKGSGEIIVVNRIKNSMERMPTQSVRYNSATREWLTWSPWELWTIYDNGTALLLNRSSDQTLSVLPLDAYGVILIATQTALTAFNPGYYVNHPLFTQGSIEEGVGVDQVRRRIYFLGTVGKTRGLYQLEY